MTQVVAGLEGVVAAETRLSSVEGLAGKLTIAGFPVEVIAPRATFEEMVFLLWRDALPNGQQLACFQKAMAEQRRLPKITVEVLEEAARQEAPVMDALRMAMGTFSLESVPTEEDLQGALPLLNRIPTAVATYHRLQQHLEPISPRPNLSHAANYLYMLSGEVPNAERVRGLETYLNTVVDHGLNASTFTARVIISTQSDLVSALVGALGALKGRLHGGAPGPALDMVFEIGEASRAEAILRAKLERGERLMGFGHRIYKVRDPRADVLASAAQRLYTSGGDKAFYTLALEVERLALALLEEFKPGRHLQTNVEFYTALLLHGLGLPPELFTPTFALSRAAGWIAHCFEQQKVGRIFRPQSVYCGAASREWVPVEERN